MRKVFLWYSKLWLWLFSQEQGYKWHLLKGTRTGCDSRELWQLSLVVSLCNLNSENTIPSVSHFLKYMEPLNGIMSLTWDTNYKYSFFHVLTCMYVLQFLSQRVSVTLFFFTSQLPCASPGGALSLSFNSFEGLRAQPEFWDAALTFSSNIQILC